MDRNEIFDFVDKTGVIKPDQRIKVELNDGHTLYGYFHIPHAKTDQTVRMNKWIFFEMLNNTRGEEHVIEGNDISSLKLLK